MAEDPPHCGTFTIAADHPCLPGHFPGHPVVPGVLLLDHALTLIEAAHPGQAVRAVRGVRFRQPVLAEQTVALRIGAGRRGGLDFQGLHDGTVVFSGNASLRA